MKINVTLFAPEMIAAMNRMADALEKVALTRKDVTQNVTATEKPAEAKSRDYSHNRKGEKRLDNLARFTYHIPLEQLYGICIKLGIKVDEKAKSHQYITQEDVARLSRYMKKNYPTT